MMSYQVVIQFPESFFSSIDEVHEFEERLMESLPRTHGVDGHDIGSGTVNFFIFSDAPKAVLANFRKYLGTNEMERKVRIAFRSVEGEDYKNLWPKRDEREFKLWY